MVILQGDVAGHRELSAVCEIVKRAGDKVLEFYGDSDIIAPSIKSDGSPVTQADHAAHDIIVSELLRVADIPVLSEEGRIPDYDERRTWSEYWLVDPLDGTKEFIGRNGEFTVNVALMRDTVPVLGVVSAPARNVMYAAAADAGSWKIENGNAVRIFHDAASPEAPLTIAESRSHRSPELEEILKGVNVGKRIQLGSSLKFCVVAEGLADAYIRLGPTMEWDVAAGDCVYRNSARHGEHASPLRYNKPDLHNPAFVIGTGASRISLTDNHSIESSTPTVEAA